MIRVGLSVALVALALVLTAPPVHAGSSPSPALMLATIQEGRPLKESDDIVQQFATPLAQLADKCQTSPLKVSDLVVVSHDLLSKRGVDESYLSILTHVNDAVPDGVNPGCADVFAVYIALRVGDFSP